MTDINKLSNAYKTDGQGRVKEYGTRIGIVKKNDDPQNMGRISVWIPELGGDPSSPSSWFVVSYASPFAGATPVDDLVKDGTSMDDSQKSYGMWVQQPHIGNEVLVTFANGDTSNGYWFACLYPQNMNHMVPGIPANTPADGSSGSVAPVVEYNKRSSVNPSDPPRPTFTPLSNGLKTQGLTKDQERGMGSSGARRESPTKVLGILSQNQNSIVVDDNPTCEMIRMRTRSGVQVLVNETTGYVYINSKSGNSWIEISDEAIDIYSSQSINLRSGGDLNFHAGRNIFFDAGANISMKTAAALTQDVGANLELKVGANMNLQVASALGMSASRISEKASTLTRDGQIADNGGGSPSVKAAVPQQGSQPDVDSSGNATTTKTLTSRMPTHEPWPNHPKQGLNSNGGTSAVSTTSETVTDPTTGISTTSLVTTAIPTTISTPTIGLNTGTGLTSPTDFSLSGLTSLSTGIGGVTSTALSGLTGVAQTGLTGLTQAAGVSLPTSVSSTLSSLSRAAAGGALSQLTQTVMTGTGVAKVLSGIADTSPTSLLGGFSVSQNTLNGLLVGSTISQQPMGYMLAQAAKLSGLNPQASSSTTTASGLFGFTDSSWTSLVGQYGAQYGIGLGDKNDPRASSIMAGLSTYENANFLTNQGITPNAVNLNFAQMLGAQPAANFINAVATTPSNPAYTMLSGLVGNSRSQLYYPDGTTKSVNDLYTSLGSAFSSQASAMQSAYGSIANTINI